MTEGIVLEMELDVVGDGVVGVIVDVVMAGLCPEHASSNPVNAKTATVLAADFIMCGKPPDVRKFLTFSV